MAEQEFGEVIEIQGPRIKVRMKQHTACNSCGHKAVCFPLGRERILIARAEPGMHTGDKVSIFFPSGPSIISSLLIFVGSVFVPLLTWLIAELARAPRWAVFTLAGGALLVYWIFLFFLNRRLKNSGWFLPRASKVEEEEVVKEVAE
jgi:positive regulator of sigma E activity